MTDEVTTLEPPYGEAETTRWLSWLAHTMQRNGETEFLFERLQPTWLEDNNRSRLTYVMVSRLIQVLFIGLLFTALEDAMLASTAAKGAAKQAEQRAKIESQTQSAASLFDATSIFAAAAAAAGSADVVVDLTPDTSLQEEKDSVEETISSGKSAKGKLQELAYRLLYVIWALIAGLTLGFLDYLRLGNRGTWRWLNRPRFPRTLAERLLGVAATCLKPLSFIPGARRLLKVTPAKSTWVTIQIEKATQHILAWVVVWVVVGLVMAATVLPIMMWMQFDGTTMLGLFVILVGLISSRSIGRTWSNDIECVETLGQSWGQASAGAIAGAAGGGIVGLAFFKVSGFAQQGVVVLIVGAIVGAAFHGLVVRVQELSVRPNQGIELSLKHSVQYGSFIGVLCGTIWGFHIWNMAEPGTTKLLVPIYCGLGGLVVGLMIRSATRFKSKIKTRNAALGSAMLGGLIGSLVMMPNGVVRLGTIVSIICIGLIAAIWFGGLELIRHFTLRGILWLRGDTPLKCVPFYNYSANKLAFLQQVGGGYEFIHRYLMEHFAEYHKPSNPSVADSTSPDASVDLESLMSIETYPGTHP